MVIATGPQTSDGWKGNPWVCKRWQLKFEEGKVNPKDSRQTERTRAKCGWGRVVDRRPSMGISTTNRLRPL